MNRRKNTILIAAAVLLLCGAVFVGGVAGAVPETVTEVSTLDGLTSAVTNENDFNVKLTANIELTTTLNITTTGVLDLNGHVLSLKSGTNGSVIKVDSNGNLTLTDSNTGSKTHRFTNTNGLYVWDGDAGTGAIPITGGVITGGNATSIGGGVYVTGTNSKFTMTGGNIIGNSATYGGGGVRIDGGGTFTMSETASITGNSANDGGGVYVQSGEFTMSETASITGNSATSLGGGVQIDGGTFTMIGDASITRNSATNGGGVCVSNGEFTMSETASITGNSATSFGGGVLNGGGTFNVSGSPVISGNTVGGAANNVYLYGPDDDNTKPQSLITVTGQLTGGEIGIKSPLTGQFGKNGESYSIKDTDAAHFFPDSGFKKAEMGSGTSINWSTTETANVVFETHTYDLLDESARTDFNTALAAKSSGSVSTYDGTTHKLMLTLNNGLTVTSSFTIKVPKSGTPFTIDLNDQILQRDSTKGNFSVITIDAGAGLKLVDNAASKTDKTFKVNSTGLWVLNGESGDEKTVTGGCITGGYTTEKGGGVRVDESGTFTMEGGNIVGNTANNNGGGVYVAEGGTFNMTGGTISGNTATFRGGGVYVAEGGTFNMNGGTISGNTATDNGGGVYVNGGTFTMEGTASIKGNEATGTGSNDGGGGVCVAQYGVFTMTGGTIGGSGDDKNTAKNGGGVYVNSGTFEMNKGNIAGNTASLGGGVYVGGTDSNNKGTFNMSNTASIKGNTATNYGGGVYVAVNGTFMMTGGTIEGNTAETQVGGGVYVGGTFNQSGGEIKGNTAKRGGGGVYVGGMFTMMGSAHIAGNTALEYSGGVSVATTGTFNVSGAPVISGNKIEDDDTNVYLFGTKTITVTNSLEDGADIRIVSPDTENTPIATGAAADGSAGYAGYTVKDSDATYFHADSGKWVAKAEEGSGCADSKLKWTTATYTVTIQSNNDSYGSVSPTSVSNVAHGTSITVSGSTLTIDSETVTATPTTDDARYSYAFVNWKAGSADVPATVTGDLTITANFSQTAKTYTVTFDANGGTPASQDVVETYGSNYVLPPTEPTRTGYTFEGWFTGQTDGDEVTSSTPFTITSAQTLYAHWTPVVYQINYLDMGGAAFSGEHEEGYPTEHTYGAATELKTATKTGYTFGGWFTESTCSGTAVTELGAEDYTNNIILYAKWIAIPRSSSPSQGTSVWATQTYTVTFSMNGHGEEIPAQYVTAGTCAKEPVPAPAADGFVFSGWYTDQGCTVLYDFSTPVTSDLTLYAGWNAVSPAVPVTQTPAGKSPAPLMGVIAGLGCAAVVFGLRRK